MSNEAAALAAMPVEAMQEMEALRVLAAEAKGKTGRIPAELIAAHAIRVTAGGDWLVQHTALEALLRRIHSARAPAGFSLLTRPRRAPFGEYRLRADGTSRAYRVHLRAVDPLVASCECRDFARGSLSLCKHIAHVLELAAASPSTGASTLPPSLLSWDAARPLTGPGDWLERVRLHPAGKARGPLPLSLGAVERHFVRGAGLRRLSPAALGDDRGRTAAVSALVELCRSADKGAVDPALPPLLERELSLLHGRQRAAFTERELGKAFGSLNRKLFPYQQQGVRRFLERQRLLLADDMGLGKTAQAIAGCHALFETGRVKKGLLVVPAALKPQWLREWRLFSDVPVEVVEGGGKERVAAYRRFKQGFLIVNYEQVIRDIPALVKLAPHVVVLDEAQRIKNWSTKTALCVKQLQPQWRLVLTGTPMENRLDELASILEWVDDLAMEPKWRLSSVHSVRQDGSREVVGARHLDTLRARIAPHSLRRLRAEVLDQLPPRTDTRVPVALTGEQQAAHQELDLPIMRLLCIARKRPLTQPEFLKLMSLFTQQRIICNGLAQREFEETWPSLERAGGPTDALLKGLFAPKLLELRELVTQLVLTQKRKVVIFSQWRRMLKLAQWALQDVLGSEGVRGVFFTGEESQKRRTQNIVDLHDDGQTRVLFATDAGGVGLNLQRAASACIHLDLPWNPAVLEQRTGRIFRMGQTLPVEVYYLVAASGIEARIAALVGDKKALFGGLFDGQTDEVRFERSGSFLSAMLKLAEPAVVPDATLGTQPEQGEEAEEAEELQPSTDGQADTLVRSDAAANAPPAGLPGAADVQAMFGALKVERKEDGGVLIHASKDAASALGAMLQGLAGLLAQTRG